jgi:hypothetical protein
VEKVFLNQCLIVVMVEESDKLGGVQIILTTRICRRILLHLIFNEVSVEELSDLHRLFLHNSHNHILPMQHSRHQIRILRKHVQLVFLLSRHTHLIFLRRMVQSPSRTPRHHRITLRQDIHTFPRSRRLFPLQYHTFHLNNYILCMGKRRQMSYQIHHVNLHILITSVLSIQFLQLYQYLMELAQHLLHYRHH